MSYRADTFDGAVAMACRNETAREDGMPVSKVERQLRRMFCAAVSLGAYMDDGEASDASEWPHIDYMRDTPDEIQRKRLERGAKRALTNDELPSLMQRRKPTFTKALKEPGGLTQPSPLAEFCTCEDSKPMECVGCRKNRESGNAPA